ncbi:CaiB/BaiF CoA transferase family protein [Saliphagus sp. GCM10025334]
MGTVNQPLDGLRVIDFSVMISGGFATMQLADFGADVISVEHPSRPDPLREWPPFDDGVSLWWKSIGRNKRCITLDLASKEGRALALKLVEDADLVFENFRPGTLEKWDLGPEMLHKVNPELVLVRLSGYGQTGPRSEKPGFGTIAEGISGWAHVNGFPDREPLLPPISLADLMAAQFAIHGATFALLNQLLSDDEQLGEVVDISLYEPLFRLFISEVEAYDRLGMVSERMGNRHANAAPRGVYETTDGHLTLSASSQPIFENVMHAINRPELIDDDRFDTNEKRVENVNVLDEIIESWTQARSTDDALERLESYDAIAGPVYDIGDIFEDEHYEARKDIVEMEDSELGTVLTPAAIPKFSQASGAVRHAGPRHGRHNEEVYLDKLELDEETYEELHKEGVI